MKHTHFKSPLAYCFIAPQLIMTMIFFIWPAGMALWQSMQSGDAFGIAHHFCGLSHFIELFSDSSYWFTFFVSVFFSFCVALIAQGFGLMLSEWVYHIGRGQRIYKILLICPYAVAPAVAGIIWRFLFNPTVGILAHALNFLGIHWNYLLNGYQALLLVILASAWQQFSYNFLFYFAARHSIPVSLEEAAYLEGASAFMRFRTIVFPLLGPMTFFLFVMNLIYGFFDTFGIIQTLTKGGPANMTNILVYKVYQEGFVGLNIGNSAAQSVILMILVIGLTLLQFRYFEKRVHYG